MVTLAILAEIISLDSESWLFTKMKSDLELIFPVLIDRSTYNRRKRRLSPFINSISEWVASQLDGQNKKVILDSIPIPICMNPRIRRSTICQDDVHVLPTRSYNPSLKMHYYGFKMQLMITQKGVPISVGITSANLHDVKYLGLLDNKAQLSDYELIADKGYLSAQYQTSLFEEDKIKLITPLRRNMISRKDKWNKAYRYIRKRIETLFSQLCDQMMFKRNYAKTFNGLVTRVVTKVNAVAVLQYLNFINGRPINKLKNAIFT
ncbi:MAG: IS982 family transposase [Spirosomataceae bacterium]